jgi:hypothetical protein
MDARVTAYAITKAGKGSRDTFFGGYRFVIEPRQVQRINFRALMHFVHFVASPACVRLLDASTHHARVERIG